MIYDFCSFCLNNLKPSKNTVPRTAGIIKLMIQIPAETAKMEFHMMRMIFFVLMQP